MLRMAPSSAETWAGRPAPYLCETLDALNAGGEPNIYCSAIDDARNRARFRLWKHGLVSALALPSSGLPEALWWPQQGDLVLIPQNRDGDDVHRLVIILLTAGRRYVVERQFDLASTCHCARMAASWEEYA